MVLATLREALSVWTAAEAAKHANSVIQSLLFHPMHKLLNFGEISIIFLWQLKKLPPAWNPFVDYSDPSVSARPLPDRRQPHTSVKNYENISKSSVVDKASVASGAAPATSFPSTFFESVAHVRELIRVAIVAAVHQPEDEACRQRAQARMKHLNYLLKAQVCALFSSSFG